MSIEWMQALFAGLFGSIIGSFLNVCIVRWPADQSVIRPRSRCPRCRTPVAWYDNVPIVSWLVLRGRCRGCGEPIGVLYPTVELLVALLWAGNAYVHGWALPGLEGSIFGTLLIGIAATDMREYIIPDEFTIGGLIIGLILASLGGFSGIGEALLGAAVGFGLLYSVGAIGGWVLKAEAMGGGDIKMMAMVGAFVGWEGVLLTVFLGALAGTLIFLPLALAGKKPLVPFGIFLALGAELTWLFGPTLVEWWSRYTGLA